MQMLRGGKRRSHNLKFTFPKNTKYNKRSHFVSFCFILTRTMTHSTIDENRGHDLFIGLFEEEITTLFCVATAPLGPDVQRVIWKEVRDDQILRYTRWTLFDINYFIDQFMICRREYPDSMFDDGSFTPSTVNMVTAWVEFLEKRAAREIRPSITISYQYGCVVVSAEKEDLWIILLKTELRIYDFITDDIDHIVEIDRHCDVLRRLQELAGFRV